MAKKSAPADIEASGTLVRPWTEAEKRLPLWLRGNNLPREVAAPAERVFDDNLPEPTASLWALINLANAAELGVLNVRKAFAVNTGELDPQVFASNVIHTLRMARDAVLKATPAAGVSVANGRIDNLIASTRRVLDELLVPQLNKVVCNRKNCKRRGRHLLPGPWIDAMKRSRDAREDAMGLTSFLQRAGTDRMRSVEWIGKATRGGITSNMLAKQRRSKSFVLCERRGGIWYHDIEEVGRRYTEYESMLTDIAGGDTPLKRKKLARKLRPSPS
ncbi:MAG: hypothetical protein JSS51_07400 [Planctomycetes bacterium]|nr:hypothetical protein [Planctomycetota bacterium]